MEEIQYILSPPAVCPGERYGPSLLIFREGPCPKTNDYDCNMKLKYQVDIDEKVILHE